MVALPEAPRGGGCGSAPASPRPWSPRHAMVRRTVHSAPPAGMIRAFRQAHSAGSTCPTAWISLSGQKRSTRHGPSDARDPHRDGLRDDPGRNDCRYPPRRGSLPSHGPAVRRRCGGHCRQRTAHRGRRGRHHQGGWRSRHAGRRRRSRPVRLPPAPVAMSSPTSMPWTATASAWRRTWPTPYARPQWGRRFSFSPPTTRWCRRD